MPSTPESALPRVDVRGHAVRPHPHGTHDWRFLTNHALVLLAIARDPERTMRDVAHDVGITERATQKIVADLEGAGYLSRERHGRRNSYTLAPGRPLRHPLTADHGMDTLLDALITSRAAGGPPDGVGGVATSLA